MPNVLFQCTKDSSVSTNEIILIIKCALEYPMQLTNFLQDLMGLYRRGGVNIRIYIGSLPSHVGLRDTLSLSSSYRDIFIQSRNIDSQSIIVVYGLGPKLYQFYDESGSIYLRIYLPGIRLWRLKIGYEHILNKLS